MIDEVWLKYIVTNIGHLSSLERCKQSVLLRKGCFMPNALHPSVYAWLFTFVEKSVWFLLILMIIDESITHIDEVESAHHKVISESFRLLYVCKNIHSFLKLLFVFEKTIFFELRLNKQLSKHSWRRWFETPSCSQWRRCNVIFPTLLSRHMCNECQISPCSWKYWKYYFWWLLYHIWKFLNMACA